MKKISFDKIKLLINALLLLVLILLNSTLTNAQMTFVHPGALDGQTELDFVKGKILIGAQPWTAEFNKLRTLAVGGTNALVYVNSNTGNATTAKNDGFKAYANALAWYYTGNVTYANQAIAVLNAWSVFQGFTAGTDQDKLTAGWVGALFGPAAEIMKGYSGWAPADIAKVQAMFKLAYYPQLNTMSTWNGNVDLTQIDAMMNIAVFCEDETEFDLAVSRFNTRIPAYFYQSGSTVPAINGDGGNVTTFWSNPTSWVDGLTQESCRDNGHHAQFAMASALHAAEVAWNQGVDLYTPNSKRFTDAMELMALQSLTGNMQNTCANNTTTNSLFDTWEVGYNHYHFRKGIDLPKTQELLTTKVRVNTVSDWNIFYETLTHADISENYFQCPKPKLGPDVSICGKTNVVLSTTLTATNKTISWYKDNVLLPTEIGTSLTVTSGGNYKVVVDSINCSFNDAIFVNGTIQVNLGGNKELCNPIVATLDAGNASIPGVSYLWNTGATTRTLLVDSAGVYSVTINAFNCTPTTGNVTVTSKLINVKSDTLCNAGIIDLIALGTSSYKWYNVASNGTALYTGTNYSTFVSEPSTTFYVEETAGFTGSFGKSTVGTGAVWNISGTDFSGTDKVNKVTVLKALTLKSIAVYVANAGSSVVINFMQGTTRSYTKTFTAVGAGRQVLSLNFNLVPGNYIINAVGSTSTLGFESSGATFPYAFSYPGYISFENNESWQSGWYGTFYDWIIETSSPCIRTPVAAIIDNAYPNCLLLGNQKSIEKQASFSLYPNPAKDKILIETDKLNGSSKYDVQVINSYGQSLYSTSITNVGNPFTIDVSQMQNGLYYIKIGNQLQKIIIQN